MVPLASTVGTNLLQKETLQQFFSRHGETHPRKWCCTTATLTMKKQDNAPGKDLYYKHARDAVDIRFVCILSHVSEFHRHMSVCKATTNRIDSRN
jgi:hypothetical protein